MKFFLSSILIFLCYFMFQVSQIVVYSKQKASSQKSIHPVSNNKHTSFLKNRLHQFNTILGERERKLKIYIVFNYIIRLNTGSINFKTKSRLCNYTTWAFKSIKQNTKRVVKTTPALSKSQKSISNEVDKYTRWLSRK